MNIEFEYIDKVGHEYSFVVYADEKLKDNWTVHMTCLTTPVTSYGHRYAFKVFKCRRCDLVKISDDALDYLSRYLDNLAFM